MTACLRRPFTFVTSGSRNAMIGMPAFAARSEQGDRHREDDQASSDAREGLVHAPRPVAVGVPPLGSPPADADDGQDEERRHRANVIRVASEEARVCEPREVLVRAALVDAELRRDFGGGHATTVRHRRTSMRELEARAWSDRSDTAISSPRLIGCSLESSVTQRLTTALTVLVRGVPASRRGDPCARGVPAHARSRTRSVQLHILRN